MSVCTKKELELSPSHVCYCSTRTCEATPPVEGESEGEEKLHAGKQDTKKLLERMRELKAEAEKAIDELGSELQNITVATNELKELRALVDEKQTELRQGLQLPANHKEEAYVEQPRASNEHKKEVDNTKRPLLKKIKGLFGSHKSTKRKKKVQGPPLQATSSQAELATPEAKTSQGTYSQDEVATLEAETTDLETSDHELFTRPKPSPLDKRFPREEFETEASSLRRKESFGQVSVVSFGTSFAGFAFPYRGGSRRSLAYFSSKFEDPGDFIEYLPPLPRSSGSCPEMKKMPYVIHDQIEITKHPKSQTAKEGSRVQFTCKVDKKRTNVIYQWFKDGVVLHGQNDSTLVLDNVDLRDFGLYMCYLNYEDSPEEGVESVWATLNVIPQNGKNLKRLGQLDMTTRLDIACLLEKRNVGLGGVTQVAYEYGMTPYQIMALENSMEPGKAVLEFLMASKPDLTVYSFCQTLKRKEFKRSDIVQRLEGHFSFREEANKAFSFF